MTDERKLEIVRQFKEEIYKRFNLNVMSDENLETVIEQMIVEKLGSEYITIEERVDIMERVYSSIRGLGVLDSIIKDDDITEVMINGPKDIFIEKAGKLSKLNQTFDDEKQLEDIIQKIVGQAGREVNQANPIVDTRLPDGSRVNVVLPPISLNGAIVTIRKFSKTPMTVQMLLRYGSITPEVAHVLEMLVKAKYNIFICGGTGSGKTTFLNAISNFIPHDERVITIEDSAELQIEGIDNLVSLETRNANASGSDQVFSAYETGEDRRRRGSRRRGSGYAAGDEYRSRWFPEYRSCQQHKRYVKPSGNYGVTGSGRTSVGSYPSADCFGGGCDHPSVPTER